VSLRPAQHQHHILLPLVRCIKAQRPIAVSNTVLRHFDSTQHENEAREMYLFSHLPTFLCTGPRILFIFTISSADLVIYSSHFSRKSPGFMGFLKSSAPVSHKSGTGNQICRGFSSRKSKTFMAIGTTAELLHGERKNLYGTTVINQPLTGRNGLGYRKMCILVITECGQKLRTTWNGCMKKNQ